MMVDNSKNNYLITRVSRILDQVKGFIEVYDVNPNDILFEHDFKNEVIKRLEYEKTTISLNKHSLQHDVDEYGLLYHVLDNTILALTSKVETKNYYFTQETVNEDLLDIINNPELEDVNWFITMDTHLEITELTQNFYGSRGWIHLKIGDKEIKTLECSLPRGIIFGIKHPLIVNRNEIYENFDHEKTINGWIEDNSINISLYFLNEFYAIRMITDEKKKKLFLRDKKIKKLMK